MKPTFVFAHGAGAPSSSAWMMRYRERLRRLGSVHAFDYPYAQRGARTPDRLPVLLEAHAAALAEARKGAHGKLLLVGKSMGGRVGCHLSLDAQVDGVICFGYPLRGVGKSGKLRDAVLLEMHTSILFVQGTRDKLCPLDELDDVRSRMQAPNSLHVVPTGDHSLEATKTHLKQRGLSQRDLEDEVFEAVRSFVASL